MLGVVRTKDCRSTTFANLSSHRVAGQRGSDYRLDGHVANVTPVSSQVQDIFMLLRILGRILSSQQGVSRRMHQQRPTPSAASLPELFIPALRTRAFAVSARHVTIQRLRRGALLLPVVSMMMAACSGQKTVNQPTPAAGGGGGGRGAGGRAGGAPVGGGGITSMAADMQRLYRSMGLLAGAGSIPFVSSVSFLRTPTPDTTLVLVAMSMPSRALGFSREGDRYAANYTVRVELRQGNSVIRQIEANESVRVPTYRETSRTDESVIWQQFLRLPPGRYTLAVAVRDPSSIRSASEEVSLEVPKLVSGQIGSLVPVYEAIPRSAADSLPRLLARPRATVTFGVDSVLPVYIEAVGADAPSQVHVRVLGEGDQVMWDKDVDLVTRGGARDITLGVPVTRMGIGVTTLVVSAAGRADTARTRIFVSLGDDLPIASFDEMLTYLRYFTTSDRLNTLKNASVLQRADLWAQFLKDTDPMPATPENEGLRDYFARIRAANVRFRDDGQNGWLSDRGVAFVGLGDPDNIYDTGANDPTVRVRQQVWEYREYRLQLVFLDQSGFGRWRLSPQAMSDLQNAIRRRMANRP